MRGCFNLSKITVILLVFFIVHLPTLSDRACLNLRRT